MSLELSHVDFSYDEASGKLIHDFSLSAEKGDVIAIKGASGSGKTTIFRLLLGFEQCSGGNITFKGEALHGDTLRKFRNNTAYLPQDLDLGEGTLKDVFYYPFHFKTNAAKKPSQEEAASVFDSLGLAQNSWNLRFNNLSTGQRQRVGAAICYFLDKEILLLDEPTSALDETSKESVKKLLFDKQRLIISASHDEWWLAQSSDIVTINSEGA